MTPPENSPDLSTEKLRAEIKKLTLEVVSLNRQNSWKGQLVQYAAIFTVLASLIGVWQGLEKIRDDYHKEQDIKTKEQEIQTKENQLKDIELRQKADGQYQMDVQQLALYPAETNQTIPSTVLRLQDLKALIESGNLSVKAEQAKHDVGFLISYIVQQTDFDLRTPRNTAFDTESLRYCEYYPDYLRQNPDDNMRTLSKYQAVLRFGHNKNPTLYETIIRDSATSYAIQDSNAAQSIEAHYIADKLDAYKSHLDLLTESLKEVSQDTKHINSLIDEAFCNFYSSTNNSELTKNFFNIANDDDLRQRAKQCP